MKSGNKYYGAVFALRP